MALAPRRCLWISDLDGFALQRAQRHSIERGWIMIPESTRAQFGTCSGGRYLSRQCGSDPSTQDLPSPRLEALRDVL